MIDNIAFQNIRALNAFDRNVRHGGEPLSPGVINVFAGPNGAGKSTVVDIVHALTSPEKFMSLSRQTSWDDRKYFSIDFAGGPQLQVDFVADRDDDARQTARIRIKFGKTGRPPVDVSGVIGRFASPDPASVALHAHLRQVARKVVYIDGTTPIPDPDVFAKELSIIGEHLYGTHVERGELKDILQSEFAPMNHDAATGLFRVSLGVDGSFPAKIPVGVLPSGWVQYGRICASLWKADNNSICLLEEPEIHLHPTLQRLLIGRILAIAEKKKHQVFMTTHSSVIINAVADADASAKLFSSDGTCFTETKARRGMLEQLGVRASDILQTNGVIWVEGPSDRMYINCWLKAHAAAGKRRELVENVDYSFCFYGGSILSHFQADAQNPLIDVIKLNKNAFFVMDNDNHVDFDAAGQVAVCRGATKLRVMNELKKVGKDNFWVTWKYTLESYLPDPIRNRYFEVTDDNRLKLRDGAVKTLVAAEYVGSFGSLDDCADAAHLKQQLALLHDQIAHWSGKAGLR